MRSRQQMWLAFSLIFSRSVYLCKSRMCGRERERERERDEKQLLLYSTTICRSIQSMYLFTILYSSLGARALEMLCMMHDAAQSQSHDKSRQKVMRADRASYRVYCDTNFSSPIFASLLDSHLESDTRVADIDSSEGKLVMDFVHGPAAVHIVLRCLELSET